MRFVRRYLAPRLIQYVLVVILGVTVIFFIPRFLPSDPVEAQINTIQAMGTLVDPAAVEETIAILREMYGLDKGLLNQYVSFWGRLFTGDFGPSLYLFPTPVSQLIRQSLPWTIGLLLTTTVLGWILGNILGGLAGYFTRSKILKIVDGIAMLVRPMPYYILALILIIFFAYLLPIFPLGGGFPIGVRLSLSWSVFTDILRHAFLPAMSLVLLSAAVNHQTMRLIVQSVKDEDYIRYAKIGNVKERTIFSRYVMRNALLPQITGLTLTLGVMFGGALITEIVFAYPGIGTLLYQAILTSDYNLIMGISTISIIAIATGLLLIDLLYPLFDPRIKFK